MASRFLGQRVNIFDDDADTQARSNAALRALSEEFRVRQMGGESDFLQRGRDSSFIGRMFNPSLSGINDAREAMEGIDTLEPSEVLAFGASFATPGTQRYKAFADTIADIRSNKFLQDNPDLGISDTQELKDLLRQADLTKKERAAAAEGLTIRDTTLGRSASAPAGGRVTSVVDVAEGTSTPVEGAGVNPDPTGIGAIFGGGIEGELGGSPFRIRASERGRGADQAEQRKKLLDRQRNVRVIGGLGESLIDIHEQGGIGSGVDGAVVAGNLSKVASNVRSFLVQAGGILDVTGVEGATNIVDMVDDISRGSFTNSAIFGAETSPIHMMYATAYARAINPKERGLSAEELKRAAEATKGIQSGDPAQVAATLRRIFRELVDQVNIRDTNSPHLSEIESLDAEEIAPRLFNNRFLQGNDLRDSPDVSGTLGSPGRREPRTMTLRQAREELEKLRAEETSQ